MTREEAISAQGAEIDRLCRAMTMIFEERNRLLVDNARLRAALKPFSDMAGEIFARNWNAGQVVTALDNPNEPHRITAGDYFAARAAYQQEIKDTGETK